MKIKLSIAIAFLFVSFFATAQDTSLFKREMYVHSGDTLPYRILLPLNYDATKKYPLIIFLHGAGERGRDNESQLMYAGDLFLRDSIRENYPAIVLFPQCAPESYWSNVKRDYTKTGEERFVFQTGGEPTVAMKLLQRLLKKIIKEYPVETKQIYAGGLSMGGMGTYELVWRNPTLVAAAFTICGGADAASAKRFRKVQWWIFHGAKDDIVLPQFSERIVTALRAINVPVKFTLYPEDNHNSWDHALAEPELLPWLFSVKKAE